jgi:hypothetical protein
MFYEKAKISYACLIRHDVCSDIAREGQPVHQGLNTEGIKNIIKGFII